MLYEDIIRNRQAEIFNQVQDIDAEINQLKANINQLEHLKELRIMEHKMLQNVSDKGLVVEESNRVSRVDLEDALKRIFQEAGRPLKISDLIEGLERYGYMYSKLKYQTAYARLRATRLLESTGAQGYYNLIRY